MDTEEEVMQLLVDTIRAVKDVEPASDDKLARHYKSTIAQLEQAAAYFFAYVCSGAMDDVLN